VNAERSPSTLHPDDTIRRYDQVDRETIERLTRLETILQTHIDDETQTLAEIKKTVKDLDILHQQARAGSKLVIWVMALMTAVVSAYTFVKNLFVITLK
jgi:hypothetical protein